MEKESAFLKVHIKLYMEISIMDNFKVQVNFIFLQETTIQDNLKWIKKMVEVYINGQVKSQIHMKDNLKQEKEMEEELFGGQMEVNIKVNLNKVFKVDKEFYLERVDIKNMKVFGIMECLMEKEFNISRMGRDMKEHLRKINSMEMEYFINKIQLFMECGKIMNYQQSIW